MKTLKLTVLFAVSLCALSCSVQRELQVVDGSKADGTLTLATEYDGAFKVKVDVQKAGLLHIRLFQKIRFKFRGTILFEVPRKAELR